MNKLKEAAGRIFVSSNFIAQEIEKHRTFGTLYENLLREQDETGEWSRKFPLVSLDVALADLKIEVRKFARENTRNRAKSVVNY